MCAIVLLAKKDRLQLLDAKSSGIPDDYVPESRFPCAERPIWLPRFYTTPEVVITPSIRTDCDDGNPSKRRIAISQ
jgi:hypothetical protein